MNDDYTDLATRLSVPADRDLPPGRQALHREYIMTQIHEDLHKEGRQARGRVKKRRQARLLGGMITAGVAVVAAAAAVVIATVPGRSSGRPAPARPAAGLQAQDAAYVLNRAAVAQVNSYHMISVDQNGSGLIYTDVATQQQRIVSALRDSSGEPYFQIATAIGGGAYTETDVEYQHHVYSTFTTSSMDDGARVTLSSFLPLQTNADPAVAFREALKAGIITVVGHRNLNGRDTILIRVKSENKLKSKSVSATAGTSRVSPAPASLIWIDASTYLVVQTQHYVPHFQRSSMSSAPGGNITWSPVIDHVTWLSPTRGNLALLTLTPPAGFTKIPYPELAQKYLGPIS
jgi:hypothetical protein